MHKRRHRQHRQQRGGDVGDVGEVTGGLADVGEHPRRQQQAALGVAPEDRVLARTALDERLDPHAEDFVGVALGLGGGEHPLPGVGRHARPRQLVGGQLVRLREHDALRFELVADRALRLGGVAAHHVADGDEEGRGDAKPQAEQGV